MRLIILVLFAFLFTSLCANAQTDSIQNKTEEVKPAADTLAAVKLHVDTLPMGIRMPDSLRHNQFIDTLLKQYAINPFQFNGIKLRYSYQHVGHERPSRDVWVIFVILLLLIYAGLLNRILSKDIYNMVQAFYFKTSFAKLSKEDSLFSSWAFICLFLLFGLTVGMYVYQLSIYNNLIYSVSGFQLYISCAVLIIVFSILKILALRVLGFVFDIGGLVREYISILYLTYFNIAFIFLPVIICFSLLPPVVTPYLLKVSVALIIIVVLFQYLRSVLSIISNFTFHKIYLFIYLCALEICPVLIIIKALDL
ncbi:DUF4271 domain-containing protein [Mucilaginibacter gracilis]|nr:DUF4271 domain-containing protein [Mucilaginibacter gracilis]